MAIYFLNLKNFGRAGGSSAVSAAAYRAGERMHDARTGKTYDHSERRDVMHKEIVLPSKFADAEMGWARDRSSLWNAAESAETRKNARVAREYLVALPVELSPDQRLKLVREFSRELADRYGFALDFAIHAPRDFPDSDPRNFHAHLLATTREVTFEGLGAKTTLEMNERRRYELGLGSSIKELVHVRERWATVTNEALREAEVDARIDHRTLAAQGIDREPLPHIPKAAFEMERHGYRNELAERLRDDYRARVEARLERAAARETAAAAEPAAAEPAASEFVAPSLAASQSAAREPAAREPAASERATAELSVTSVAAKPQTLEDIRREARENWLRMRQSQGYAHGQARGQSQAQGHDHGHDHDHGHGQSASAAKTDHSRDDDFAR
jgi:ATP-dependent exoDNAse (exonuclease V) alpha subunit